MRFQASGTVYAWSELLDSREKAVADYRAKFKRWPQYVVTEDEMECWDVRPCEACGNPIFGEDYRTDADFYYHPACAEPKTVEGRVVE